MVRHSYGRDDRSVALRRRFIALLHKQGYRIPDLADAFKISQRSAWGCLKNANQIIPERKSKKCSNPLQPKAFIYAVRCGDFLKVGVSTRPQARLRFLQAANPLKLELVGLKEVSNVFLTERAFHERMAKFRTNGEWFKMPPEQEKKLVELIAES